MTSHRDHYSGPVTVAIWAGAIVGSWAAAIGLGRLALIGLAAVGLVGCASTAPTPIPKTVIQEVDKPVAKSCVPAGLREPPSYADDTANLLRAQDADQRYQLLQAGREQRIHRLAEVEPVIKACR